MIYWQDFDYFIDWDLDAGDGCGDHRMYFETMLTDENGNGKGSGHGYNFTTKIVESGFYWGNVNFYGNCELPRSLTKYLGERN